MFQGHTRQSLPRCPCHRHTLTEEHGGPWIVCHSGYMRRPMSVTRSRACSPHTPGVSMANWRSRRQKQYWNTFESSFLQRPSPPLMTPPGCCWFGARATRQTVVSIDGDCLAADTDTRADNRCTETQTNCDAHCGIVHLQTNAGEWHAKRWASRRTQMNTRRWDWHSQRGRWSHAIEFRLLPCSRRRPNISETLIIH